MYVCVLCVCVLQSDDLTFQLITQWNVFTKAKPETQPKFSGEPLSSPRR